MAQVNPAQTTIIRDETNYEKHENC